MNKFVLSKDPWNDAILVALNLYLANNKKN